MMNVSMNDVTMVFVNPSNHRDIRYVKMTKAMKDGVPTVNGQKFRLHEFECPTDKVEAEVVNIDYENAEGECVSQDNFQFEFEGFKTKDDAGKPLTLVGISFYGLNEF